MTRVFSLAYLTVGDLSPPDAVAAAAEIGYQAIGVRIAPAAPGGNFSDLIADAGLRRATVARMKDTGVGVFDVEVMRIDAGFDIAKCSPFLETCAALGAKAILVAGDDPDLDRMTQSYAAFCAAARPFGLTADLEFMPWTTVSNARTAMRIVRDAAQPNGGILVDALHFARSASTLDDIGAIPPAWLHYGQICDAPAQVPATVEGLIHTARHERLLPGDGGIELARLFATLPATLPVSVEIPNDRLSRELGSRAWARRALAATQTVLASVSKA